MEKLKSNKTYKRASFYTNASNCSSHYDNDTQIRLGISCADEKAKIELRRRKIEEPLSIEERILIKK